MFIFQSFQLYSGIKDTLKFNCCGFIYALYLRKDMRIADILLKLAAICDIMRKIWPRIKVFLGIYVGLAASIWGITEAYTYFTGDNLRAVLGSYWWLLFHVFPLVIAALATVFHRPNNRTLADKKTDDAREKVRQWGARVTSQQQRDEQSWHLLGHALQFSHEAIEKDPKYQRPWTLLADIYCRIGERKQALECLRRSYKLATPGPYSPGRFYLEVEKRVGRGCPQTTPRWFREKYARYWVLPLDC